jgi:hypothetical protein
LHCIALFVVLVPMADAVAATPPPPEYGTVAGGESSPSPAASPEFEFWMVGKNTSSFPSPALLTAAELFSGGVVLPLRHLQASPADEEAAALAALPAEPPAESGIAPTPDLPAVTFKWKDIFKPNNGGGGEPRERKKAERRVSGNAELININIWPFARSRSAGHSAAVSLSKAKPNPTNSAASNAAAPAPRKVSSAPCSRSSSRGESGPTEPPALPAVAAAVEAAPAPGHASMLRRLVPGRGRNSTGGGGAGTGIRLGRPSPVWQLRRNKLLQQQPATEQKQQAATEQKQQAGGAEKKAASTATDSDDKASVSTAPAANGCRNDAEGGEEGPDPPQGRFGLRTLFSKKVY